MRERTAQEVLSYVRDAMADGDVPHHLTACIGWQRDREVASEAINEARLVTLIGVGGVEKTRELIISRSQGCVAGASAIAMESRSHPRPVDLSLKKDLSCPSSTSLPPPPT
jgi:hypothetical protein